MRITYNDLCIRNAEGKDCEQFATWWNDGSVMAHAGFPNGLGTTAEKIKEQIANDSDDIKRRLIIEYRDVSIGEMNFCVYESKKVEIGFKKIAINENSWMNQLGEPQTSIDYELKASDFCNAKLIG